MLFSVPALIKILCVFGLILLLNRLRLTLSLCLFLGSLVLSFWMKMGPGAVLQSAIHSLTQLQTISLFLIVGSILVISRLMKESRHMDRIVEGFARLSGNERTAGLVLPALIGLLPMPGGALFSAPMVETTFNRHSLSGEQQTAVNYWFRHIWEYWWPLYPAVVLAGMFFILKPIPRNTVLEKKIFSSAEVKSFLWEIMPILIVVMVIIFLEVLTGLLKMAGLTFSLPAAVTILPGLLVSIIWVCWVNRITLKQLGAAMSDRGVISILLLVAAIMIFQGIMNDSRAVFDIRAELMNYKIPILMVVMIMPFLSGLITGIGIGFVGTSFPLVIPLFPTTSTFDFLSYAALAYVLGFMGMMLSPVHLCFLVTKDYFKANLLRSYRYFLKPLLAVASTAIILFIISRII
jgi:hypothetical protein